MHQCRRHVLPSQTRRRRVPGQTHKDRHVHPSVSRNALARARAPGVRVDCCVVVQAGSSSPPIPRPEPPPLRDAALRCAGARPRAVPRPRDAAAHARDAGSRPTRHDPYLYLSARRIDAHALAADASGWTDEATPTARPDRTARPTDHLHRQQTTTTDNQPQQVRTAGKHLLAIGQDVTFAAVAQTAGISRASCYRDLRSLIDTYRSRLDDCSRSPPWPTASTTSPEPSTHSPAYPKPGRRNPHPQKGYAATNAVEPDSRDCPGRGVSSPTRRAETQTAD
jgi:hypothetical protein